ncbi:MAG: antibiotic biosynthesis monooxygenase [Planctomycetales bacterium]|nr:antibiotic biosynthesis monooxygenase [Planctomycetales bacterium]
MAEEMMALAAQQPGFLSVDSIADGDGRGITCSYWRTLADIEAWKANARHLVAQRSGRKTWYERYRFVIAKDERVDEFRRLQD